MCSVRKTVFKCYRSNCAFAEITELLESLSVPSCLVRRCQCVGTGSHRWRPGRSWKTSFLGLNCNRGFRWLPLAGLCLAGFRCSSSSRLITLLGASQRFRLFHRRVKSSVWLFLFSSAAVALLIVTLLLSHPPCCPLPLLCHEEMSIYS